MHATGKIFGKTCLTGIRDKWSAIKYVVCNQERKGGTQFLSGGDIQ